MPARPDDGLSAGALNGTTDALLIPNQTICFSHRTWVELWARPRRVGEWMVVGQADHQADSWVLNLFGEGQLTLYRPGMKRLKYWADANVADGQWHHLAVCLDPAHPAIWIDGQIHQHRTQQMADSMTLPHPLGVTVGTLNAYAYRGNAEAAIRGIAFSESAPPELSLIPKLHERTLALYRAEDVDEAGVVRDAAGRAAPARFVSSPELSQTSLDELDRRAYAARPSTDVKVVPIELRPAAAALEHSEPSLSLDGDWELIEGGTDAERVTAKSWPGAVLAAVPGGVHAALVRAGHIPDPTVGRQDEPARAQSFKTWWYRRRFKKPSGRTHRLVFDGVAVRCSVWLNGEKLGDHEGAFGGPHFDLSDKLKDDNELIVRIDPAPTGPGFMGCDNGGWRDTVTFNCVYGWHYCNIPSLGIWRSVRIEPKADVELAMPFVVTTDAEAGQARVEVEYTGPTDGFSGTLEGTIQPENFSGPVYSFSQPVRSSTSHHRDVMSVTIPEPRLWWPNGYGRPNLYRLTLHFSDANGNVRTRTTTFGLRTVRMEPIAGQPHPGQYNWTFVINNRPMFLKGTGWCTLDPLMDFSRSRYERFLGLARQQHCQMVRAWGSGMPETDEFYDVCDRQGLLVMQEWPTAWNSHWQQPLAALEETVRLNTLRLRNHPSLVMWTGGNESSEPFGEAIDIMGRCAIELDGTRPFHRGEPWGGSTHNYTCWWENAPLDWNVKLQSPFFGEFGLASVPVEESVRKYLPADEQNAWPPTPDSAFAYHTPVFNTKKDLDRVWQYAGYFTKGKTRKRLIVGSQLAQAVGVRHTLERARTRWPYCTGALMYKLNDNMPAVSWSTADWYGAAKLSHWVVQDAFAPLAAVVRFDTLNVAGRPLDVPVFLLDDVERARHETLTVRVRVVDAQLNTVVMSEYAAPANAGVVCELGNLTLTAEQTAASPLLVVAEVRGDRTLRHRTFYVLNFDAKPDCLFELPATSLSLSAANGVARITNEGPVPAVGALVTRPGYLDTFDADENVVWLDPGETIEINVNATNGLTAEAWNGIGRDW